jgi:hypothetical protein
MSGIILPAGAKTAPMPNVDALPEADREALAAMAAKVPVEETYPEVRTAFAVLVGMDGQISVDPALVKNVRVQRQPHNDDVIGALAAIKVDLETSLAAMKTAQIMQQQAQAMQQALQERAMTAQVSAALAKGR